MISALLRFEHCDDLADRIPKCIDGPLGFCAQERLQFSERLFDRIKVWAVRREVKQSASRRFNCPVYAFGFMRRQVVHDDDVARCRGSNENLLNIGQKRDPVHRAVDDHGCSHARKPECSGECRRFPVSVRDRGTAPLSANSPPAKPGHFCTQACFIDKDETCRIEIKLSLEPVPTTLHKVGALLLQCMCGLFLNVQPRFRSQTSSPLRPMETARSSASRRTISLSVTSFASSIIPTM